MYEALILLAGLVIGSALLYLLHGRPLRERIRELNGVSVQLQTEVAEQRNERERFALENAGLRAQSLRLPALETEVSGLRERNHVALASLVECQATMTADRNAHLARVAELTQLGEEIQRRFSVLATEALGKNSQGFLQLVSERFEMHKSVAEKDTQARHVAIESLIKPVNEGLAKFEATVSELEKSREGSFSALKEQIRNLAEANGSLRTETGRLVQALRKPQTRGRWGEYQLRNVLEMAGMVEHSDFVEQQQIVGPDGALRPDVIVRLPGGKAVVVDAKTPLDGYLNAIEANDENARKQYLAEHAKQLSVHITKLGSKEYWDSLAVSPDFVVMFIPGEAIFSSALDVNPQLLEEALQKKVMISSPTTFMALVKAIAYGWQQERIGRNAQAVADLGRDLYQRIRTFSVHISELGRGLDRAVEAFNKGVGSFEGRVMPAARKFESLGVVTSGSEIESLNPIELEPRDVQSSTAVDEEKPSVVVATAS